MTPDDVQRRVDEISRISHPPERDYLQDRLLGDILIYIARAGGEHSEIARLALDAMKLSHDRWYA